MKKVLLATTALIAASAFAAPAKAELEVTVGGFTSFQAGFFDNEGANSSDRDFQSEAQIAVHADGTADNGLQYGAKIVLNTSTSDADEVGNADKTGIYLAGSWGRVELGDDNGASELNVFAPTVGAGQINGSYDDFIAVKAHQLNDRGDHNFTALDSGTSTKITYYTPKFSGFQAGVSFVPELDKGETVTLSEGGIKNGFEIGAKYEGNFQNVGIAIGGGFNFADAGDTPYEDVRAWSLGAQLSYNGFKFGGGYTDNGDSAQLAGGSSDDVNAWNVGVSYENGPWGIAASYLDIDYGTNGRDATALYGSGVNPVTNYATGGDYTAIGVGGTYKVAPGLTTSADVVWYDRDANAVLGSGVDGDGFVALLDVTAAF